MMANSPADILVELEQAVATCSPQRCARILSGMVGLIASGSDKSQELLVDVVDRVLLRLTELVAPTALIELSEALAGLSVAPQDTLRHLASHKDPAIARPILLRSQALTIADLVAVATSCGETHQLAISARSGIEAAVADTLLAHGTRAVHLALIRNTGTQFSDAAFALLIEKWAADDEITKTLALRPGTPDVVLRKLLSASSAPKPASKPNASVQPPAQGAATGLTPVAPKPLPSPDDYAGTRPGIVALNRVGKLNDSTVNRFAIRGETANLLTALSVLSGTPIEIVEHVATDEDCEGLVMACRASRLNWATTLAILSNRRGARLSFAQRERAQHIFETLLLSTSQWTVRWGEIAAGANTREPGHRGTGTGNSR